MCSRAHREPVFLKVLRRAAARMQNCWSTAQKQATGPLRVLIAVQIKHKQANGIAGGYARAYIACWWSVALLSRAQNKQAVYIV